MFNTQSPLNVWDCLFLPTYQKSTSANSICQEVDCRKYATMLKDNESVQEVSPLRQLRSQAGLSQVQLARLLSIGGKTVSDRAVRAWEKGEYQPELTIPQTKALCRAFGVSLDQLPDSFAPSKLSDKLPIPDDQPLTPATNGKTKRRSPSPS